MKGQLCSCAAVQHNSNATTQVQGRKLGHITTAYLAAPCAICLLPSLPTAATRGLRAATPQPQPQSQAQPEQDAQLMQRLHSEAYAVSSIKGGEKGGRGIFGAVNCCCEEQVGKDRSGVHMQCITPIRLNSAKHSLQLHR